MSPKVPLSPEELRRPVDPASLGFETTAELDPLEGPLGQGRAVDAAHMALALDRPGYNLFVLGPSGFGKHAFVRRALGEAAAGGKLPEDLCYVHDFDRGHAPRALTLPAGRGRELVEGVHRLIDELAAAIPAALETDSYRAKVQQIEEEMRSRPERIFKDVEQEAKQAGVAMVRVPSGVAFAPMKDGEVLSPDEFEKLSDEERAGIEQRVSELQQKLGTGLRQLPRWGKEAREKVRALTREATSLVVDQLMEELCQGFADLPKVSRYLGDLRADLLEHADAFRDEDKSADKRPPQRYQVNQIVDHSGADGAPVVYEDRPAVDNLLGRIEHRSELGTLVSDFTLIKGGALHRANGGYLMLDLRSVLVQPHAWEVLKRALFSGEIRIESLGQLLGFGSTATLEPEPVPLRVKVVMIGDRQLYHLLSEIDSDVQELFKVVADFDDRIERTPAALHDFARLVASMVRHENLRPFDRGAVARVIEERARATGDSRRLSTSVRELTNLLGEAEFQASERGAAEVSARDVIAAVEAQIHREDRLRGRLDEQILDDTILIDTSGERVGQVNGLAVLERGGFAFGMPTRITATARVGDGKVVDIEREVELGGPLHSKGVLILSSYFAARYTRHIPLSLSASLVFEQSYLGVEGDSASLAELCALLSALSGVPVRQHVAVTGSVNQHGVVQAIGGVNEKIEGFFDICKERGLTGEQAVIIPASNVPHLMLRDEVVAACREKKFAVYPVNVVDEAIELLTGWTAGEADDQGDFPEESVNARVLGQLIEFAVIAESFGKMVKTTEASEAAPAQHALAVHRR